MAKHRYLTRRERLSFWWAGVLERTVCEQFGHAWKQKLYGTLCTRCGTFASGRKL